MHKTDTKNYAVSAFILALMIIGGWVRWSFLPAGNFPINDGGLFYRMTDELVKNKFQLPAFTTYNHQNIPFTYPPLGFYLAGAIHVIFKIDILAIERYLPVLLNILAIPFFFLLARALLKGNRQACVATILFTFSKSAYEWLIMGGGLTRSPAYTLFILIVLFFYQGITQKRWIYVLITGLLLGICLGFHIEIAYTSILIIIGIWLYFGRNRFGFKSISAVALLTALFYGPIFLQVIKFHGIAPYFNAFHTSQYFLGFAIIKLFMYDFFAIDPVLNIPGGISLLGLLRAVMDRKYFLPIWLVMVCLFDPRSMDYFALIPASMLFAYGLDRIFLSRIATGKYWFNQPLLNTQNIIACFSCIPILLSPILVKAQNSPLTLSLSQSDFEAMEWVNSTAPENSIFLIIPTQSWGIDPISEWFPALTDQQSYLTIQGMEWTDQFTHKVDEWNQFIGDVSTTDLDRAVSNLPIAVDYIYCSENSADLVITQCPMAINGYESVYARGHVTIFARQSTH